MRNGRSGVRLGAGGAESVNGEGSSGHDSFALLATSDKGKTERCQTLNSPSSPSILLDFQVQRQWSPTNHPL